MIFRRSANKRNLVNLRAVDDNSVAVTINAYVERGLLFSALMSIQLLGPSGDP
jgi:hypothetical protein